MLSPKEVRTGGSLEKRTMLAYKLDADVICIYNRSKEVEGNWYKLMRIVYKDLRQNFPNMEVEEAGKLAIHIKTDLEGRTINFDVVPCYYVNSPQKMEEHTNSKLYTAITTIWHSRFILRYKNLPFYIPIVRLLKDWRNEQDVPLKSIHLELITTDVYDWCLDNIGRLRDGDIPYILDQCFEDITDTLDGYPIVPSNWKYCNPDAFEEQYTYPVLIDPANPADNLLSSLTQKDVAKIRKKVKITRRNLQNECYVDIFNRKGLTHFFD
jgi:tRNA nucleotidyltransferase (CCA-adding enzyme)